MQRGYAAGSADQMALPRLVAPHGHAADFTQYARTPTRRCRPRPTGSGVVEVAVTGPDQLRSAWHSASARSFSFRNQNDTVNTWQEATANYYDLLAKNSFGNFRTLLNDVTLSPRWPSTSACSAAAKARRQGGNVLDLGRRKYAREVMQLSPSA